MVAFSVFLNSRCVCTSSTICRSQLLWYWFLKYPLWIVHFFLITTGLVLSFGSLLCPFFRFSNDWFLRFRHHHFFAPKCLTQSLQGTWHPAMMNPLCVKSRIGYCWVPKWCVFCRYKGNITESHILKQYDIRTTFLGRSEMYLYRVVDWSPY